MQKAESMQEKFDVLFYEKEDGSEPAKEFLNSLDKKMLAKMTRTIAVLQTKDHHLESHIQNHLRVEFSSCVPRLVQTSQESYISFLSTNKLF